MREIDLAIKSLDRKAILRCLSYGRNAAPSPEVVKALNRCTREAQQGVKPRGAYVTVPITGCDDERIHTGQGLIKSRKLADIAAQAKQMAFCLLTLGKDFDLKIEGNSDLMQSCIWDAIGTTLVEQSVEVLLTHLRTEVGMETSLPFSPGYCDWVLEGQQVIFSAFGDEPLGIRTLPGSWMMVPQKSVSFVVCLGIQEKRRNPCRQCALKSCFMRRQ